MGSRAKTALIDAYRIRLIQRARQARKKANSYRHFRVGCAVLAYNPNKLWQPVRIFAAANYKPDKKGERNDHAEQRVIEKARKAGYTEILMLVLVGDYQVDQQSGRESLTLHLCGHCRDLSVQSPLITAHTIFIMERPDRTAREEFVRAELLRYHAPRA